MVKDALQCDFNEGICNIPTSVNASASPQVQATNAPITVIYFTDPICSSCWGIEPQLKKLKLEYGHLISIDYRMGGLLPDWNYNSGGISEPKHVAAHWQEVSTYYEMPIDGDIWLEDPLHSSFPPSFAFKAAQLQHKEKAVLFLRKLREMVFLEKKNITKWENIETAAVTTGLDTTQLKADIETHGQTAFAKDLDLARTWGVRGFPTLYFINNVQNIQTVYGFKPYQHFENAIKLVLPTAEKIDYNKEWQYLFSMNTTLTTKEFSELSNQSIADSEQLLQALALDKLVQKTTIKRQNIWRLYTSD
jgi:putative protein-disulfide isomerase